MKNGIVQSFKNKFGNWPEYIIKSPGRINLIGEHTDYNDGFVLPMGIQNSVWLAMRKRADKQVNCCSQNYSELFQFSLDKLEKEENATWGEYIKGVAWALQQAGYDLTGWEGYLYSDIPIGAGLSSSAALELTFARAFSVDSDIEWDPKKMAIIGQQAENTWVGVNCGIMDQLIVAAASPDCGLLIDCRTMEFEEVPLPPSVAFLIMDTSTRRDLLNTTYNERRQSCVKAADYFGKPALRDVTLSDLKEKGKGLDEVTYKRALHVVSENERTLLASKAMRKNNINELGKLISQSHVSLRENYEVSSHELDLIVDIALSNQYCYGARMTGAGFGGCAIALVDEDHAFKSSIEISQAYDEETNLKSNIYISKASGGTKITPIQMT